MMKLNKIEIINFGQLSSLTFNLPDNNLSVFFGANEAGKSTTVAFIKQVMFGFYLRNNSAPFFEDYKPLSHVSPMGGSLFFNDGNDEYQLERLWVKGDKTKKGILTVKKNGQVVPETEFFDRIHNIDGDFYADSFIFNQEMLGQIAKLNQADLLERIYYLGASNSSQLIEVRDDFAKQANDLFKKAGRKPEVNRLLKQIDTDQADLTKVEQEFGHYQQIDDQSRVKVQELAKEKVRLQKLNDEKKHLLELEKQLQNYTNLQLLKKKQQDVNFDQQAYQKAQTLTSEIKTMNTNLEAIKEQLADLNQEADLNVDLARQLVQKKPELLQWQADYKSCLQKEQQLKNEAEQILTLTPEVKKLADFDQKKIDQLKQDYQHLAQKKVPEGKSQSKVSQTIFYIGLPLFIIGGCMINNLGTPAWVMLASGLIIMAGAYYNSRRVVKQNKIIAEAQKNVDGAQADFDQKYDLNPANLDLNNLLTQLNQYQFKKRSEEVNKAQLQEIKNKVDNLATSIQNALKKPIKADFASVSDAINQVDNELDQYRQITQHKTELESNLKLSQQKLAELKLELQKTFTQNDVLDMKQFNKKYQTSLTQAKLNTQVTALENSLQANLTELSQLTKTPDEFKQKLAQVSDNSKKLDEKLQTLQADLAELEVKKNNLADSSAVFEAKQKLANTKTLFINASKEYLADLLASQWVQRTLDLASNERFPKMLQEAKEYLKLLTGERYVDLILDKKLQVINNDGKKRDVKYLSRATSEQLYFALKLAFIDQIKDQINLPILIDDSFVNFDDYRIDYIKKLLDKIAENNQVLIFTAQENLVKKLGQTPLTYTKG